VDRAADAENDLASLLHGLESIAGEIQERLLHSLAVERGE
jgi:hypothetical protein